MTSYYEIFGYQVESMIELPARKITLEDIKPDRPEIFIELGKIDYVKGNLTNYFDIQFNYMLTTFSVEDTAIFQISGGNSIKVDIMENASNETVILYLLGSAFGFLMHQKKCFPLHGSAAVIDDSCVVIVGHSGAGKSSLSSGFIKNGFKLLTDDVARYEISEKHVNVFHSYPSQKLWSDTIQHMNMDDENKSRLIDRIDKFCVKQTKNFESQYKTLKAIIEIIPKDIDEVEVHKLNISESLSTLLIHTYRFEFFDAYEDYDFKREHFKSVANLLRKVPVYRMFRPQNRFTVDEQVKLIIETIGGDNDGV